MSCLQRATDLYGMIGQGQAQQALDKYYADDCVIVEATGDEFTGKERQKERLGEWQAGLEGFHGGGVYSITANEDENVSMVESWVDITVKGGHRMKFEEVAVQHWEGDKIKRERFYYNPGP